MKLIENTTEIENFLKTLEKLPDSRGKQGRHHSLAFIVFAVILAVLEGNSNTSSLQRYIKDKIFLVKRNNKNGRCKAYFSCIGVN